MALSHDNAYNMYETNFILMDSHKYSLEAIENMIPYEREIYISLLQKKLKKEARR